MTFFLGLVLFVLAVILVGKIFYDFECEADERIRERKWKKKNGK